MAVSVQKKAVGSYPFASVILSLTLALLIFGLLVVGALQGQRLLESIKSRFQLQVMLKRQTSATSIDSLKQELASQPWIARTAEGKPAIRFISKDQAARQFIKETGEDFIGMLEDNPLLDALEVKLDPAFTKPDQVKQISTQILSQPQVYEVSYQADMLNLVNRNLNSAIMFLGGLLLLVILGVALLINNTIRLAMYSQRFLIRSMQLVGASAWFITKPFVFRALTLGLLAGLLASGILVLAIQTGVSFIPELALVVEPTDYIVCAGLQLLMGVILGAGGAFWAVRRYLDMSLEQLY